VQLGILGLLASCGPEPSTDAEGDTDTDTDTDADTDTDTDTDTDWQLSRVSGPTALNSSGRALFASIMVENDTVWTTYQTAGPDSLTGGKNLYYRTFDRDLVEKTGEALAIDVFSTTPVDWDGDLGDQKLLMLDGRIFMVALVKGESKTGFFEFDQQFKMVNSNFVGSGDDLPERALDMGFGTDGVSLYAQFFQQEGDQPDDWGASVYRVALEGLNAMSHAIVYPESGNFVTGTSIVHVPVGDMGVPADQLQSFSTNLDYGNSERVGIHTFAMDMSFNVITGSTKTIVERELDTYFPVGCTYNAKHQFWVVTYTMENFEGEHGFAGALELGPSFVALFDPEWNEIETIAVNDGAPAFRVMTQTVDDDLYVVYDEMDKDGTVTSSQAKIEHYTITSPAP